MKKLFTLTAIMLMLVLPLSLFAACDNSNNSNNSNEGTSNDTPSDTQVLNFEDIVSDKMSDADIENFFLNYNGVSDYRYSYDDKEISYVVENNGRVAKLTSAEVTIYFSKEDGKYYRYDMSSYGEWSKREISVYDTQLFAYQMYVEVLFETADFASMKWSDTDKGYVYSDGEGTIVLKFKDGKLVGARSVYSQDIVLVFYDFGKVTDITLPSVGEDETEVTEGTFGSKMPSQTPMVRIDPEMSAIKMLTAGLSNYYGANFVATSTTTSTEDMKLFEMSYGTQFATYKTIRDGSVAGGVYSLYSTAMSGTAGDRQLVSLLEETYIEKSASSCDIRFRNADEDDLDVDATNNNVTLKAGAYFNPVEYYGSLTTYEDLFAVDPEAIWLYDLNESTVIADECTAPVYNSGDRTYSFTVVADPTTAAVGFRERALKVFNDSSVSNSVKDLKVKSLSFDVVMWENGYIKSVTVTGEYSVSVHLSDAWAVLFPTTVTCCDEMSFCYYDGEEGFSSKDIKASKFGKNDMPEYDGAMELLMLFDDVIESLGDIDNVGNLGADSYIEFVVEMEDVAKKIRIDLDLSLDLLDEAHNGNGYAYNGFGFTVSVDEGDGTLDRVFGIWYVDELIDDDSYIYLSAGGQNVKIDGLTLAAVLEKYCVNVNVNIDMASSLEDIFFTENSDARDLFILFPQLGINIGYQDKGNQKVFILNVKELIDPASALGVTLDEMIFQNEDIAGVLSALGLAIEGVGDIYNMIPDIDIEIVGNYDANGAFESIGLGLAVGGKSDGITIPTKEGDGIVLVEGAFSDTNLSATLGFDILTNEEAWKNVYDSVPADADSWNEIGAFNYYFEGQITLGKTVETASTYDVLISADIDLAAIVNATLVQRLYYTENGVATYQDVYYLRGEGPFANKTDLDFFDVMLPAINSLYVKIVNVNDPEDIFLINLDQKITLQGLDFNSGSITFKLKALSNILETFDIVLDSNVKYEIERLEGTLTAGEFVSIARPFIAGIIYAGLPNGTTTTAPLDFNGTVVTENTVTVEEEFDVLGFIYKLSNCMTVDSSNGSVRFVGSGADYTVSGGAALDFNIVGALLKDEDGAVDGFKINVNKFVADYNNGEVVTSFTGNVQIGGGEIFKAVVSANQYKTSGDPLDLYIGITVDKIGYGCAVTAPISVDENYEPTSSLHTDIGWMLVK